MTPAQQHRIEELLGQTELGEVLYFLYRKRLIHPSVNTLREIDEQTAGTIIQRLERGQDVAQPRTTL